MNPLDDALLQAHARDDRQALVDLYGQAADQTADLTAQRFYTTHAYVFALELGSPKAETLRQRLVKLGAEPAQKL